MPAAGDAAAICPRCGRPLGSRTTEAGKPFEATRSQNARLERALSAGLLVDEDWALEAELRGVERMLRRLRAESPLAGERRVDPAHAAAWAPVPQGMPVPMTAGQPAGERPPLVVESPKSHLLAWLILSVGLSVFACGALLLAWSVLGRREDLWPIGLPLVLVGQAGLILGVVLQLDGLWSSSRRATTVLHDLDSELARVRQATTLLSAARSSPGQSFYAHLAEGAPPQMLLADLKGQLDLLARQIR